MRIKFIGATESVTGSKHLVITSDGRQILLDCGLFQGMGPGTGDMNRKLAVDPAHLSAVLLSHAHIDHCGNLPNLVKHGFNGPVYCTPATRDVCSILLPDSAHIHEHDAYYINKRRRKQGQELVQPLYTVRDAEKCLEQFRTVPFDTDFSLGKGLSAYFSENGHVIGSAAIHLSETEGEKTTRLSFTGDVGRYKDPLLRPPAVFQQSDYIICESTYGDTRHDDPGEGLGRLKDVVYQTCVERKGKLVIPAFSLGRTQEILYALDQLENQGLLSRIPVFVDSPLSSAATKIVRSHPDRFNEQLRKYLKKDSDPFGFEYVRYVQDVEESKKLNAYNAPCIVISASGMADAGRVKHHIASAIGDERNGILITGYCAPNTLGARLARGERQVRIFGDTYQVNARVNSILSLSAHADYAELLQFLSCQDPSRVREIFLVHGEDDAKTSFKDKLSEAGFSNVTIPSKGEIFQL